MRTIQVSDRIYRFLLESAEEIGEDASSILERLLNLSHPKGEKEPTSNGGPATENPADVALRDFLTTPRVQAHRTATDKFLQILSFVHTAKQGEFENVLQITGRKRRYFSRSRDDILQSGRSTRPREIPDSNYWVVTNTPTTQKKTILRNVLKLLDYSPNIVQAATRTIT